MAETPKLASLGLPEWVTEDSFTLDRFTGHMRWRGAVLQQAWETTHYAGGQPLRKVVEWRDIPAVPEDATNAG